MQNLESSFLLKDEVGFKEKRQEVSRLLNACNRNHSISDSIKDLVKIEK
jgi:hypothetical protein